MTKSEPARSVQPSSVRRDTDHPCTASDMPLLMQRRGVKIQAVCREWKLKKKQRRFKWNRTGSAAARSPAAPRSSKTPPRSSAFRLSENTSGHSEADGRRLGFHSKVRSFTTVSLTVECVYIQQHGALPLVGGPLQLGGGVDADSRRRELQSGQQLVLAQRAVLARTVV